jgi:hypothetical protein
MADADLVRPILSPMTCMRKSTFSVDGFGHDLYPGDGCTSRQIRTGRVVPDDVTKARLALVGAKGGDRSLGHSRCELPN